jgi:hypothetical protein
MDLVASNATAAGRPPPKSMGTMGGVCRTLLCYCAPLPDGTYPHPFSSDPHAYVRCTAGKAAAAECPGDQRFIQRNCCRLPATVRHSTTVPAGPRMPVQRPPRQGIPAVRQQRHRCHLCGRQPYCAHLRQQHGVEQAEADLCVQGSSATATQGPQLPCHRVLLPGRPQACTKTYSTHPTPRSPP